MKEKDLDKNLETLIIEGLIKEAEKENVDFAMAMRLMSDDEFKDLVTQLKFEDSYSGLLCSSITEIPHRKPEDKDITDSDIENAKLCDNALDMSKAFIDSLNGDFDFSTASTDEIKTALPTMKARFDASIIIMFGRPQYLDDFLKAGWILTVAYLKLHKKDEAVDLLKKLESQSKGTPFGEHCAELLKKMNG